MAPEMERLISRHDGIPLVAPSMQELPLSKNPEALKFGETLLAGRIDMLLLLTGVGFQTLMEVLQTRFPLSQILDALKHTTIVARGPKPVSVLKTFGLSPQLTVHEPNTWKDVLETLDQSRPEGLHGVRMGVQEYGAKNEELMRGLEARGAEVVAVPVYRWTLPEDLAPLNALMNAILQDQVDVLLITNAVQVDHLVRLLHEGSRLDRFRRALGRMVIASIGPIASERLRQYQFPVDVEPSHSKMGILVKETSRIASRLLHAKRSS